MPRRCVGSHPLLWDATGCFVTKEERFIEDIVHVVCKETHCAKASSNELDNQFSLNFEEIKVIYLPIKDLGAEPISCSAKK
ncbi:MAG: hypothetical protein M2R45_05158 [Verrucomicrobia subdivision 3 bacterium]|nr:hypothetical protein [Limisphaerales bacterium]MCS1413801.1 hypothetical protein [Limisphaerales bacterium]